MNDKGAVMEQVLDRYGTRFNPTRSGWQSIRCPNQDAHAQGDRNPSCRLSLTLGLARCMGCDLNGDGYNIVMLIENVDFVTAKKQLGEVYVPVESDYLF